jgi:hypothetical protein
LDRNGQAFPVNGNGNFRLTGTASFGYCWSCDTSNAGLKARYEFLKARPARRAFQFLGHLLLGDLPPYCNELFQHLASIIQAMAFLKLVEKIEIRTRQINDELAAAFLDKSAPIGALSGARSSFSCRHESPCAVQN